MSTYIGRNANVKIGNTIIAEMADWAINITADVIRADVFGTDWAKKHGLSATDWNATINGLLDISDTNGQQVLENAVISGTKITDIKFYVDDVSYYAPDTTTDSAAGCYITAYNPSTAQGDVAKVSISVEGTGPIKLFSS